MTEWNRKSYSSDKEPFLRTCISKIKLSPIFSISPHVIQNLIFFFSKHPAPLLLLRNGDNPFSFFLYALFFNLHSLPCTSPFLVSLPFLVSNPPWVWLVLWLWWVKIAFLLLVSMVIIRSLTVPMVELPSITKFIINPPCLGLRLM